jgi:hypothetical protein
MRKLDLALFLLGETALTQAELTEAARWLGYPRKPQEPDRLMRVQPVKN